MAPLADTAGKLTREVFDASLAPRAAAGWATVIIVLGASYCLAYAWLQRGHESLTVALGWSACAILPWFVAFEAAKRRLIGGGAPLRIASLFLLAALTSIVLERVVDSMIFAQSTAPVALQALRRVPAAAAAVALTAIVVLRTRATRTVPARPGALPVVTDAIDWVRAADNYIELHGGGRVVTCRMTMRDAQAALAPAGFVRIHRSLLVRTARADRVAGGGANAVVVMRDGAELPIGPSYRAGVRRLIG